uniref:(northern house mosquito) hypothetical protein n=1 Tax=Culex pipiens TaxID=7175 RepID=A0A8D8DSD9_CULPI
MLSTRTHRHPRPTWSSHQAPAATTTTITNWPASTRTAKHPPPTIITTASTSPTSKPPPEWPRPCSANRSRKRTARTNSSRSCKCSRASRTGTSARCSSRTFPSRT